MNVNIKLPFDEKFHDKKIGKDFFDKNLEVRIAKRLSELGVASRRDNTLFQSCHILHKQGRYFIVHFKELFLLDGKKSNLEVGDVERRNTIATLLQDWGLVEILNKDVAKECAPMRQIKIISYKDKASWDLQPKYNIGNN